MNNKPLCSTCNDTKVVAIPCPDGVQWSEGAHASVCAVLHLGKCPDCSGIAPNNPA